MHTHSDFGRLSQFRLEGHVGFSLWDEGFLWYGVQRVMVGEVTMRDFMSYDPGRYYWCAAIMAAWGDNGIMALRAAVAIFQAIGLFIGLSLVAKHAKWKDLIYCLLVAVTLAAWMFPRHKLFDISLSMMLLGVLTHLVMNPRRRSYFLRAARNSRGLPLSAAAFFPDGAALWRMRRRLSRHGKNCRPPVTLALLHWNDRLGTDTGDRRGLRVSLLVRVQ
jgi:hypothetical protein